MTQIEWQPIRIYVYGHLKKVQIKSTYKGTIIISSLTQIRIRLHKDQIHPIFFVINTKPIYFKSQSKSKHYCFMY